MTINIEEYAAGKIREGLRPDAAILAACKKAGRAETVAWLKACEGHRGTTNGNLTRLANHVLECLLGRHAAWEYVEGREIRQGDFITFSEDALIAVTGSDRDGRPGGYLAEEGPTGMHWGGVVADGFRVDQRTPMHGGYFEIMEVKRCPCCGAYKEEDTRGDIAYAYGPLLRLVRLGSHYVGASY